MEKMNLTPEQKIKFAEAYEEAVKAEREAKAEKIRLYNLLVNEFFDNPVEGSKNRYDLENGFEVKLEHKINRSAKQAEIEAVSQEELEEVGLVLDDIIQYKPEVRVGNYKKLNDEQLKVASKFITERPGTGTVTVVPKKG